MYLHRHQKLGQLSMVQSEGIFGGSVGLYLAAPGTIEVRLQQVKPSPTQRAEDPIQEDLQAPTSLLQKGDKQ